METRISDKIIRNTKFNVLGHFWTILVALFLTPYIIGHIGMERFGIWAIVTVLTGYFGLLDFGIGTSFIKYIAEFYTKKDYEKINQVINTGVIFYSIFAALIILLAFLVINPLLNLLNIPQALYSEARFVFLLGIIIFAISNALSAFGAIQGGLQRMDITNKVAIAVSMPAVTGTIFFLEAGYGLPGLIINNAIVLVITSIINIIIAFKLLPKLTFNPFLFTREMLKKLFEFGYKLQVTKISGMVSLHIDKLLIAYFLSLGFVTFYQLGSSIVDKAKSIPLLLTTALLPAFSEVNARQERQKLIEGYIRGTKYLGLVTFPLFTFLIISAPHMMMIWMGQGYERSAWIIQILAVGWLFNILVGVGCSVVQAIGKPEIQMRASLINIILNLTLSIILIIKFGFVGVVIGTSISVFLTTGYFVWALHKEIRLPIRAFLKDTIFDVMTICICVSLLVWGLGSALQGFLLDTNRITSLIILFTQGVLFLSFYLIALQYKKPFDGVDIALLKDRIPFIGHLIARFKLEERRNHDKTIS